MSALHQWMPGSLRRRLIGAGALLLAVAWAGGFAPHPATAQVADNQVDELEGVGITEHRGETIPLELDFVDEEGKPVKLGDYFQGERPVILTLNYYVCPMLCGLMLNGMVDALKEVPFDPGQEYEIVTVSFNPTETSKLAKLKKQNYLKYWGNPAMNEGWHFLTGKQPEITAITEATGFGYRFNEETQQFVHAAVLMVCTPDGRLSRYLYGVQFDPPTIKMALLEAGQGKIGSPMDQILLYCFHYDETAGRYAPAAMNLMRIGGTLVVIILAIILIPAWLKHRHRPALAAAGAGSPAAPAPQHDQPQPPGEDQA